MRKRILSSLCVCLSFAIDSCGCVSAVFSPWRHGPTLLPHDVGRKPIKHVHSSFWWGSVNIASTSTPLSDEAVWILCSLWFSLVCYRRMAGFHLNFSMVALCETTLSLVTFEFCNGGVIQRNTFLIVTMYEKRSTLGLEVKLFCSCTKACS